MKKQSNDNQTKKLICLEMDDKIYYTLIDGFNSIDDLVKTIKIDDTTYQKFIITQIYTPMERVASNIIKESNFKVTIDDQLEYIHYMMLYNCDMQKEQDLYLLLVIVNENGMQSGIQSGIQSSNYILKFPEINNKLKIKHTKILLKLIKNNIKINKINNYPMQVVNYKENEKIYCSIKSSLKDINKIILNDPLNFQKD